MTESSPAVFLSRNTSVNYLTVGPPVPNTSAKIVDPTDVTKLFGPGEVGEILVKGPQVSVSRRTRDSVRILARLNVRMSCFRCR